MRTLLSLIAFCLFCASAAAQRTVVSGAVKDANGTPYSGGTLVVTLSLPLGASGATLNGVQIAGSTQRVTLDNTGSFLMQLPDNAIVLPGGTQWTFNVNISPGVAPPLGTGPQSCSATLTITGASQSVSGSLSACPTLSNITAASAAFPAITSGTNNGAAMLCGTGCSIGTTGTGTNAATSIPFPGITSGTNNSAALVCGTGCSIGSAGTGTDVATSLASSAMTVTPSNVGGGLGLSISASTGGYGAEISLIEGAAGTLGTGQDNCYADSILHGIKCAYNGAAFLPLPVVIGSITVGHVTCFSTLTALVDCTNTGILGITFSTLTNCASSASPAVCGSAAAGSVAVPIGATPSLTINTTAVTANSQIQLTVTEAPTTGTRLGVTCNTTLSTLVNPVEIARVAGTSFTIQMNSTLALNPACVHYIIFN